jgi:UDP-3-O-[3-hydroxymyristoyl] glucosamine N-acyltransferase
MDYLKDLTMNVEDIVNYLASDVVAVIGNNLGELNGVVPFSDCLVGDYKSKISWVNEKNASVNKGKSIVVGLLLINETSSDLIDNSFGVKVVVSNPRLAFQKILAKWFSSRKAAMIESSANIHPSVKMGEGCYVGHNVVIEEGCEVGLNCEILHNSVVLKSTIIGNNVRIGANCTIGNYGFGYELNDQNEYQLIEHLGNVVIHDNVELHNNTCIDRAVIGSTILRYNVKVDNLVHIAHGAIIEKNSLIIAHAMIAGSVRIGENTWVSPGALVKNKVAVGSNSLVGLGAVVLKDVSDNEVVIGNPSESINDYKKWSAIRKDLMLNKNKE